MIELYTFGIFTFVTLIAYGYFCVSRGQRAELTHALMLLISSATLGGAAKVMCFTIYHVPVEGGKSLIHEDFSLAVPILAGSLSLGWFAVEQMIIVLFPKKEGS